ncbi:MAG: Ig-like domain-containing protein [Pseudomonadota bacterium]
MLPRRCFGWLLLLLLALPFACAPTRHEFLADPGSSGDAGTGDGGTANAGRTATGGTGHNGGGGKSVQGGDAGEVASAGEGGSGAEGGEAGTGPTAGNAGSNAGGGASGGGAPSAGSGGTAANAGSGGSFAGAGGGPPVAPTIVDTTPANDAIGVRSDQSIVIAFSQPMNKTVTQAAFDQQSLPAGTFSWSTDSKTMTYKPSSALVYATGTVPASTQAKLYTFRVNATAESAAGMQVAAAKTIGFTTAKQITVTLSPTELWSVKATSSATTWPTTPAVDSGASQCTASDDCDSLPVGDDSSKIGVRGVFRYDATLPSGAFVQDVQMFIGIGFSNGSITNFGSLQLAKAPSRLGAGVPTGAVFSFTVGTNGTLTSANLLAPGLISSGSFGTNDLYVSVQWSVATDADTLYDNISITDGRLLTHYLIP